jgi:D-aminoacyl-tRNA deacylase
MGISRSTSIDKTKSTPENERLTVHSIGIRSMRALLQRVLNASVAVDGRSVGQIGHGLLLFVGFETGDTREDLDWLSGKVLRLRIFADENGAMNRSIQDICGALLVVSQFTLYASTKKGNRPSFIKAAPPAAAEPMFNQFCARLSLQLDRSIERGVFGAHMTVNLVNDGPVTVWIDSKQRE